MTRRMIPACLPLLALAAGCLDESRTRLVADAPTPAAVFAQVRRPTASAPATEAAARRVLDVGRKLIVANPKVGIRPLFITVGSPKPEIFHNGGGIDGYQVYVSEGLVDRCKDDAELAAALSVELGKIISEREALAGNKPADLPPPISETIGNDVAGTFGGSDGTRVMELARYEKERKRTAPQTPLALARQYLEAAGYAPGVVDDIAPLLRQAEDTFEAERQLGTAR